MLKTDEWNGRLWQFEEENAPEDAVEVVSYDVDSPEAPGSHAVDGGESVATPEDGKDAVDPADGVDAAANPDADDPSTKDEVKESEDAAKEANAESPEDGKGAADSAGGADAAANSDGDDPSADDAAKESKDGEDEGCKTEKQPARKQATKPNKQARTNTK